jgi:TolB-like protein/DNA-binding winged helix-turn-helix (wHTH) protein
MAAGILEFGEFDLDCERFELRRNGIPLRLERKPMELLILLASSGGRLVTRPEIVRCLWDTEVFVDTEHGINTAIRKIRHVLRENPENPRFLQTVTGKGYRFVGVTPKPQPAPSPAQPAQPTQPDPPVHQPVVPTRLLASSLRAWLTASVAIVLAILLAIVTFGARSVRGHTAKPAITSIAVLPLDNLSGDPTQDYLADGMTDELTTQLAKDSTLRVISRTSVMQYKGAHRPLPEIARQLNVDGILEGSLARSADKLHMTVQLIHAPTDTHLWAESYDRNINDLVSLPHDAALSIARETHSAVVSTASQKYVNPAAHDAYLHGHYLWFSQDSKASGQYFLKATQIQPDYAPAWSGLSTYYGAAMVDGILDPRTHLQLQKDAALKSVQLDDSLPEAHLAMAASRWIVDWDFNAALKELDRALQLDPKFTEAHHLRGKILGQLNRHDEALAEQRIAMEINPFERPWSLALFLLWAHQFDAAIADAQQRLEADPDDPITVWILSAAYLGKGMTKESEAAFERYIFLRAGPSYSEALHRAYVQGGYHQALVWRLADMRDSETKRYVSPYYFASLYAQLGDRQHALAYLDEAVNQHSPMLFDLQQDTTFDILHSDPHYRAIVQKTGLPPAW